MLLRHHPTKKASALRFIKLSLVFNSHFLIVFVLATFNTSLKQHPVWISLNWLELLRMLDNIPRKLTLAFTIWYRSIQSMSDPWLDIHTAIWSTVSKRSVFLQFCDQIQPSMHQIFTQIHSTASIGSSYMKIPSEFPQARLKRSFSTFHCRTFSFCYLPSFSSLEPSYPILESQKTYKISIGSE